MRILLADDHEVVRIGLRTVIARRPSMEVVGEAGTGCDAVSLARQLLPDVVLMDVRMPGGSGLEACRQIKAEYPEMRVIILTSYPDDDVLFEAISAGADGYVLKQVGSDDLIRALERVGQGESMIDPLVANRVWPKCDRPASRSRPRHLPA